MQNEDRMLQQHFWAIICCMETRVKFLRFHKISAFPQNFYTRKLDEIMEL